MFDKPDFSEETINAIKFHAVSQYPNESCGIIVADQYIPCENIATDPRNGFKIADSVIVEAGSNLRAIVHSHPDGNPSPSEADMRSQMAFGCIFGIVVCNANEVTKPITWWGDFRLEEPLIGRTFLHGITDCYGVVRSYFWQVHGIKVEDLPRDDEWWNNNGNLYVENFDRLGFDLIQQNEVREGDCFFGKVRSKVPNHGGVILDRGLMLHHVGGKLSLREPIARWGQFVSCYLRYRGLNG